MIRFDQAVYWAMVSSCTSKIPCADTDCISYGGQGGRSSNTVHFRERTDKRVVPRFREGIFKYTYLHHYCCLFVCRSVQHTTKWYDIRCSKNTLALSHVLLSYLWAVCTAQTIHRRFNMTMSPQEARGDGDYSEWLTDGVGESASLVLLACGIWKQTFCSDFRFCHNETNDSDLSHQTKFVGGQPTWERNMTLLALPTLQSEVAGDSQSTRPFSPRVISLSYGKEV